MEVILIRKFGGALLLTILLSNHARAQSADDFLTMCLGAEDKEYCEQQKIQFVKDFALAHKGRTESQRNVGFCLSHGCNGAVLNKPILACAWRTVVLLSGDETVDASDTFNFNSDCGKLSATEKIAAEAQVRNIAERIKNPACR